MENNLNFEGLELFESEYGKNDGYNAILIKTEAKTQEEIDRFEYDIIMRTGIDAELQERGIEINSFENFQQFQEQESNEIHVNLNYQEDDYGNGQLLASAAWNGLNETSYEEVSLNDTEQKQFDDLYSSFLSKDKESLMAEYDQSKE